MLIFPWAAALYRPEAPEIDAVTSRNARRTLGSLLFVALVLGPWGGLVAAEGERSGQPYLEGLDLTLPAFETFRGWPPDELIDRLYRLPWNEHAFRRAALFGRPVFFVLTVDWSRAAQKLVTETLADPEVLRAINESYILVVVNADLRPDIRARYQTGGWPAMALLLPTGYPVLSRANDFQEAQPITTSDVAKESLLFVLREGTIYWNLRAALLAQVGQRWGAQEGPDEPVPGEVDVLASELMARWLMANADTEEGGFGIAPKFLVPALEEYAGIREARSLPALRRHSRLTLERLIASPLFDAREGGMHRLALAPSFGNIQYEKLLVGNAQLVRELVVSLRGEDGEARRAALRKTTDFIGRTLARSAGGFFLAQSADPGSPDGGGYWRGDRVGRPPPVDELVLSAPNAIAGAALLRAALFLDDPDLSSSARAALELVLEEGFRAGRGVLHGIEPATDTRGYLSSAADVALAFADAYETTGERRYLEVARDIVDFVRLNLKAPDHPTYRDRLDDSRSIGLLRNERRPLKPNVRLARAMLRLGLHGLGEEYREEAGRILGAFSGDVSAFGVHGVEAGLAIEEAIADPLLVRIYGPREDPRTRALRRAAVNSPLSWTVVLTAADSDTAAPSAEILWGGDSRQVSEPDAMRSVILEWVGGDGS